MALEIQVDKTKMISYLRRPFPKNAGEIGIWKMLMEFASLLGILINTAIITYTNDNFGEMDNRFIYFLLIIILSYGVKFTMFLLYVDFFQNPFLIFNCFFSKNYQKIFSLVVID